MQVRHNDFIWSNIVGLISCLEHIGMNLGVAFVDVFAHITVLRSLYKGLKPIDMDGHDWDQFAEQ